MDWLAIILFGILQGITEFLPISSSGHLTLFQFYSDHIPESLSLNIAVHVGTLFTVLYFYRREISRMITGVLNKDREALSDCGLIILSVLPTAIIGLAIKKFAPAILINPLVASFGLVITGFILFSTKKLPMQLSSDLTIGKALIIGIAQGCAVLPGISRAGLTIVTALWLNVEKTQAARFSFLISVPAIAGAALLEAFTSSESIAAAPMVVGALVSFVVGIAAIHLVVIFTQQQKLSVFSYYLWLVGTFALGHFLIIA